MASRVQLLRLALPRDVGEPELEFSGSREDVSNYLQETLFSRFDRQTQEFLCMLAYSRTPMGSLMGSLSSQSASDLGAVAIRAAVERSGVAAEQVDRVLMGSVLLGGQGQAPARQAALKAGLPQAVPCTTISKVCGSGMEALILAHAAIGAGLAQVAVAGGMESMSNAPYLLPKARGGARLGHATVVDSMLFDGLEDRYGEDGRLMGSFGDAMAAEYGLSRADQDAFAMESLRRARAAQESGAFDGEIAPVTIHGKATITVGADEQPTKSDPSRIPSLRPAFAADGTVTAANASSISDGAAALVLADAALAEAQDFHPRVRIVGVAGHAGVPARFPCAPVPAVRGLLDRLGWSVDDVDLWEINEAFAMVAMIAMQDLKIPHDKLNVNGGPVPSGTRSARPAPASLQRWSLRWRPVA